LKIKEMKILITGTYGFVGTNLSTALANSHQLYGLDIVFPEKKEIIKTFSWNNLAVIDSYNIEAIIHLAGKAHDTKNQTNAASYFEINTDLTKKIFDYFLQQSSCKKFIYFSSVKAVADSVDGVALTEDIIPSPKGSYGESKLKAEEYILKNERKDKDIFILRPAMIHGPGNKGNLNLLYQIVKKGIPWPLGLYDNLRSFTSIDNLIYIIERILTENIKDGIYNIADDEAVSTNDIIKIISELTKNKTRIWNIPKPLIKTTAQIGDFLHLPLNNERLHKLTENYIVSNKKIKNALEILSLPVNAKEGLRATIQNFISN